MNAKTNTTYELDGKTVSADDKGYLLNVADWSPELAELIANNEEVDLSEDAWEIIHFLRDYYHEYQIAPASRVLVKAIARKLGADKGSSLYLYNLFPLGPALQAGKIAGLPKPSGCI